ncbi:A disintegrin and metalloproteinase with thrombospondin motifs 7-like [Oncorhynchus clarkii lewisi]|uniref:A disintegrin and metalloproteinase with thrombospondin motifs 7-like n=1 Tax=Oncorhynchus clarkii lewisi TaxID=490388 RepID=UPI0039B95F52
MIYLHCGLAQPFSPIYFLVAAGILAMFNNSKTFGFEQETESFLQGPPEYEVVHPYRVDAKGHFLSNFVSYHVSRVQRRETQGEPGNPTRVFYQLQHGGHNLHFNLTLNPHLLAPGFLTERRYGGMEGAKIRSNGPSLCHFIGDVWDQATMKGRAAISTCDGLTGLFKLSQEEFFIRPLERSSDELTAPQVHIIYKRHTSPTQSQLVQPISGDHTTNGTCGVKDPAAALERVERQRERWERRQRRKRRIRQRSISREKWVETLVVADSKMVEYHGTKGVESYVLAVMNIVSGLFHDASIGNPINIVVVRLILLEKEEEDLKITHHADNSLSSFCKWQKRLNMKGEEHAVHHDVAVLLTRKDICTAINKPCETLGLSHVAGMCQPHRSCSISEDTGLPLAFTVTHELGHNFGIQHDGNGNDCEPIGKRPFIMSPQLLYGTSTPSWSRCSRQYITRFLDRGWGWCLDDPPMRDVLDLNSVPPGVLYSAAHQCRLQYGSGSLLCDDVDNVCSTLWCTVGTTCHSKLDGAVDGTRCGEDKWCFDGECVAVGHQPESVKGGWAPWSEWSACSRTCGAGVQNAQRDCVNPVPKYGGKYCVGERRRYKICNSTRCPPNQPSFRLIQCSHFNTMLYKGKFYKWVQVNNRVNPCELHCRPLNEYFSEKMLDAVIDGTQCYEGSLSRDMCVNGICKNVGCDYEIDSNAVEDRCGVCHGNGSTCETVKKTFEESEGLGYVDIGLIPEGAREIRIEEVAEAGNFLALRSDDPGKYFLNGGWTIQWNGEYKAAGTVFTYERTGQLENLTSPGPTLEPVWIQLLFQETNPGVRYEYTIHRETLLDSDNDIPIPGFFWKYGSWTECSATCGTGVQRQIVHCVERTSGIVEEGYCDPTTRPDDKRASCNEELCPAIWWVGEWQKCSATCGEKGLAKRTVLCIQAVGLEENRALQPSECHHIPRPESAAPCNTHVPCPADWSTGNWSECSLTCGGGVRSRKVVCSRNTGVDCDPRKNPSSLTPCYLQDCPQIIDVFGGSNDWSGSGSSSKEINEINSMPDSNPLPKHSTTRAQPRAPNNLNNIIPHPNHIDKTTDNSAKNNVPVDDFYYDYNFIKFHEDISYDFGLGNNGKDLVDDPGPDPQQEPQPSSSAEEHVYRETTTDPSTATSPISTTFKTTPFIREVEEPQDPNLDNAEIDGRLQTEKPNEVEREEEDLLLSEDYFLPVSTTPSAPVLETRFSQSWKETNGNFGWPHYLSTASSPVPTSMGTTENTPGPQSEENDDENTDPFVPFDVKDSNVGTTIECTTTAPVSHDYEDGTVPTTMVEEVKEVGVLDYNSHQETAIGLQSPGYQDEKESPLPPLDPPSPGPVFEFETYEDSFFTTTLSQWEATTSLPYEPPAPDSTGDYNGFFPGEPDFDQQDFEVEPKADSEVNLGVTDSDFTVTSRPVPQEPHLPPSPPPPLSHSLSGNQENIKHSTSTTGSDSPPPTHLEGDPQSPPPSMLAETEPATVQLETDISAQSSTTGPTPSKRANAGPPVPSPYGWSEIDYNEILIPPMLRSRGMDPSLTYQPPVDVTTTTPQDGTKPMPPAQSPEPAVPPTQSPEPAVPPTHSPEPAVPPTQSPEPAVPPTHSPEPAVPPTQSPEPAVPPTQSPEPAVPPPQSPEPAVPPTQSSEPAMLTLPTHSSTTLWWTPEPTPVPSPASTPNATASFWRAGNWSACSTSCGLGAIWRLVVCSTGLESDCDLTKRPVPARRCYLRPCSSWRIGNWTKCSKNCGGGVTLREIQCFDTRDQRPLRPFHCQTVSTQPVTRMPCLPQPCLDWYSSSWGQCSEVCGGGEQQRLVTCPEEDRCDEDHLPSNIQACNSQPCSQWVTGSWGQCSASCGGGVQRRLVKCVNTKTEPEEEEDHAQCDSEPWPENSQKCNLNECDSGPAGLTCLRDRLTFRFCQTLQWLGRCHLPAVRTQCCKTCGRRSRGNERTSRR